MKTITSVHRDAGSPADRHNSRAELTSKFWSVARQWAASRRRPSLWELSAQELKDIGIDRSMIWSMGYVR